LGRLRTLAILVGLGAANPAASGAADGPSSPVQGTAAANPATPATRPEPPAAPKKYLESGALLFNKRRFDLAAKYLSAAQMYRDRLTPNEQVVLDVYREQLDRYARDQDPARGPAAPAAGEADPAVVAASTVGPPALDMSAKQPGPDPTTAAPGRPSPAPGPPAAGPTPGTTGTQTLRGTTDVKQNARWLLHQAREQISRKQFDAAEKVAAEARGMGVKWGYFDDTPDKVMESITKARARQGAMAGTATAPAPGAETGQPRDRRTARARMREARAALAAHDVDKADAIAREVRAWNLHYNLFDDTPDKIADDADEARRRAAVRSAELMVRSYSGPRVEPTAPATPNSGPPPAR